MRQGDIEQLTSVLEAIPELSFICLDVANGYSEHFVEFVKRVRSRFAHHTIMVSNKYSALDKRSELLKCALFAYVKHWVRELLLFLELFPTIS